MRYWVYINDKVDGPHNEAELVTLPGFTPDTLICSEASASSGNQQWLKASSVFEFDQEAEEGGGLDSKTKEMLFAKLDALMDEFAELRTRLNDMQTRLELKIEQVPTAKLQTSANAHDILTSDAEPEAVLTQEEKTEGAEQGPAPTEDMIASAAFEATQQQSQEPAPAETMEPAKDDLIIRSAMDSMYNAQVASEAENTFQDLLTPVQAEQLSKEAENVVEEKIPAETTPTEEDAKKDALIKEITSPAQDDVIDQIIEEKAAAEQPAPKEEPAHNENIQTAAAAAMAGAAFGMATAEDTPAAAEPQEEPEGDLVDLTPQQEELPESDQPEELVPAAQETGSLEDLVPAQEPEAEPQEEQKEEDKKEETLDLGANLISEEDLHDAVTDISLDAPHVQEPVEEPAAEEQPLVNEFGQLDLTPIGEQNEPAEEEPAAEEPVEAPAEEEQPEVAEEPAAEEPVEAPAEEEQPEVAEEPVAEEPVEEPAEEEQPEVAEEPAAEEPVEEPAEEEQPEVAEEPAAEEPVEEPAEEEQPEVAEEPAEGEETQEGEEVDAGELTEIQLKEGSTYLISDFVPSAQVGEEAAPEVQPTATEDTSSQEVQDMLASFVQLHNDDEEDSEEDTQNTNAADAILDLDDPLKDRRGASYDIRTVPMVQDPTAGQRLNIEGFSEADDINAQHDVKTAQNNSGSLNKLVIGILVGLLLIAGIYFVLAFTNMLPAKLNVLGSKKEAPVAAAAATSAAMNELLPDTTTATAPAVNLPSEEEVVAKIQQYMLPNGKTLKEFIEQKHANMRAEAITWKASVAPAPAENEFSVMITVPPADAQSFKIPYRFTYNFVTNALTPTISDSKNLMAEARSGVAH